MAGRLRRRQTVSSAAWVFGLIFLAEVTVLIYYMKATLVPKTTSAITAFTSSSREPQGAAAADPIQMPSDVQEQEQQRPELVAPLTIGTYMVH